MIIGILICTIGILPIVLALNVDRHYKGSELYIALLLYMMILTIWQFDVGILYFKDLFNEKVIFFIFRLFRIATIFVIPVLFYISYVILKKYCNPFQENSLLNRVLNIFFSKHVFYGLIIWSSIVYIINWTVLGIKRLKVVRVDHSSLQFYFPEYGPLFWVYLLQISSVVVFLFLIFLLSKKTLNENIKSFLSTFSICSILLFVSGLINFSPGTGVIGSTMGVIFFSVIILLAFINLNKKIDKKYHQLIERQKKLDYAGNLAGSLIHEVNNTNQIIMGFSNLLKTSGLLKERERDSLEMIIRASEQLDNLSKGFKDYIRYSELKLKIEDINQIIEESINLSKEFLIDSHVEISFIKKCKHLRASVNKTYLQQVFINLIKNSVEAMPPYLERRQIKVHTDSFEKSIIINFYDSGTGIPPHDWENVFDPFMSSKGEGMGFGLPFVKKIILEHRGDIKIINSSPSGTHFQIEIPQFDVTNLELMTPEK